MKIRRALSPDDVLEILKVHGAIITDSHIVYTSGKHGSKYINKDAVYPHTQDISKLCLDLASLAMSQGRVIDTVIGPALGGIILSQWTAHHLTTIGGRPVFAVYAEKSPDGNSFVINRGYHQFVERRSVLVVEDILNTGGSAQKVVDVVRAKGGEVIAVSALCNRGGVAKEALGVPHLFNLVEVEMEAWDAAECPLCKESVPVNTEVGKGRQFLADQAR